MGVEQWFIYLLPKKMASDKIGVMEETVTSILAKNICTTPPPPCYMLKVYNKINIFIPVDIMEDVIELVARKILGSLGPGATDSEDLHT